MPERSTVVTLMWWSHWHQDYIALLPTSDLFSFLFFFFFLGEGRGVNYWIKIIRAISAGFLHLHLRSYWLGKLRSLGTCDYCKDWLKFFSTSYWLIMIREWSWTSNKWVFLTMTVFTFWGVRVRDEWVNTEQGSKPVLSSLFSFDICFHAFCRRYKYSLKRLSVVFSLLFLLADFKTYTVKYFLLTKITDW